MTAAAVSQNRSDPQEQVLRLLLITDESTLHVPAYRLVKPVVELVLALLALAVAAPLLLICAVLIKATSRGPVLYRQQRVGRNGLPFMILKLRTMHANAEALTGAIWSAPGDPRVTPVGRLLRAMHLDEFPQLINVLRGQMSLVGPRPERPEIVEFLSARIPGYDRRLVLRPGITGLAQVYLPPDRDLEGVRKKLVYDLEYVRHLSAWTDLRILLSTALFLLGVPLSLSRRLLRIPQPPPLALVNEPAGESTLPEHQEFPPSLTA